MTQLLWKTMSLHKKLKIELLFDPSIPLLGVHPKEWKAVTQRYLYSHIPSSVIHSSQEMEQLKCPRETKSPYNRV